MRKRNKIIILIIMASLICFFLIFINYPYVKVKVVYDSSLNQNLTNDKSKIKLTYTENNKNYYYNKNGIVVTGDKADYGEYILTIPVKTKNNGKVKQLRIRYMKYNNWYKSKININLERRKKNKKEYLFVKTTLTEGGRFQKDKRNINKQFLFNSNKFEMDLDE